MQIGEYLIISFYIPTMMFPFFFLIVYILDLKLIFICFFNCFSYLIWLKLYNKNVSKKKKIVKRCFCKEWKENCMLNLLIEYSTVWWAIEIKKITEILIICFFFILNFVFIWLKSRTQFMFIQRVSYISWVKSIYTEWRPWHATSFFLYFI